MARVILALGNPGKAARTQKHNAGQIVLQKVIDDLGVDMQPKKKSVLSIMTPEMWRTLCEERSEYDKFKELSFHRTYLAQSSVYMNLSGSVAASYVAKICDGDWSKLMVVHDDLDLPVGVVKLRGLKQHDLTRLTHNGVRNVAVAARGQPFYRLRIGVDRGRPLGHLDTLSLHHLGLHHPTCMLASLLFAADTPPDKLLTAINTLKGTSATAHFAHNA
ncbi:Peptidyl-tRNA hydrolase [Diplonema papillatum]|nr:Peptidyl-tRNA hydrolase [Diplonema papillatum]